MPKLVADHVVAERLMIDGKRLCFRASELRKENTGVHGKLELSFAIGGENVVLASSQMNLDRHQERIRLSNAAFARLGIETPLDKEGQPYDKTLYQIDVDRFCNAVWPLWISQYQGVATAGDIMAEPDQFLLDPYIIEGAGTILFGEPGFGKSYIAKTMAIAVDSGVNRIWHVRQAKTLFVNLERSANSVTRRIGAVNAVLGLDPDRPLLVLNARGKSLHDVDAGIKQSIEENEVNFVVLDSISRAGMGGSMVEDRVANAISDILNGFGVTWLAIGHPPRGGDHIYGSTMFDTAADIIVQDRAKISEGVMGIQLIMHKSNDTAQTRPHYLKLTFDQYGLSTMDKATPMDFPGLHAEQKQAPEETIYRYFVNEVGEDTATHAAEELGLARSTVASILNNDRRYQKHREANRVLYSVRHND